MNQRDNTFDYVQGCIENEGFEYCFDLYSSFKEVKDDEFHVLRKNYLESKKLLVKYIGKKAKEEMKATEAIEKNLQMM